MCGRRAGASGMNGAGSHACPGEQPLVRCDSPDQHLAMVERSQAELFGARLEQLRQLTKQLGFWHQN